MTRRSRASSRKRSSRGQVCPQLRSAVRSSGTRTAGRRVERVGVEARARAGVAGRADLVDPDEQGVAVAVQRDVLDVLDVPRRVALVPQLLPAEGPEGGAAGC